MFFNLTDESHTVSRLESASRRQWADAFASAEVLVRALICASVLWGCADGLGTINIDTPEMPAMDGSVTTDGFVPTDRDGSPNTPTTDGDLPSIDAARTDGELPSSRI